MYCLKEFERHYGDEIGEDYITLKTLKNILTHY